jgi:anti-anti-sigma factor
LSPFVKKLIEVKKEPPVIIATVTKECLDSPEGYELKKTVDCHATAEMTTVVIDLGSVRYMSTAFIGTLVEIRHDLSGRNKRLALIKLDEHNRKVIVTTKLDKILCVFDTQEEALRALA